MASSQAEPNVAEATIIAPSNQPVLKLENVGQILESRKLISGDGAYQVKVTNLTYFEGKWIVNFNAMSQYQLDQTMEALGNVDVTQPDPYRPVLNFTLNASLRPDVDFIPSKGEVVKIIVETITTKKSGVTGLFVTSVSPLAVSKAATINFKSLFAKKEEDGSK